MARRNLERQKQILDMYENQHMSFSEIAKTLGLRVSLIRYYVMYSPRGENPALKRMRALAAQGLSIREISTEMKVTRNSVRYYFIRGQLDVKVKKTYKERKEQLKMFQSLGLTNHEIAAKMEISLDYLRELRYRVKKEERTNGTVRQNSNSSSRNPVYLYNLFRIPDTVK